MEATAALERGQAEECANRLPTINILHNKHNYRMGKESIMGMNYIEQRTRQVYYVYLQTLMVSRSRLKDQRKECLESL